MGKYGYVRVSTKEQNMDRQYIAMEELGLKKENIYFDQMSGKDFERPQYRKLMKKIRSGDILVIKSIDRLGRNYSEILEEWARITKKTGADIQVIDMPLLNTQSEYGGLTGKLISDLVLQILAYVAETERVFIKQRQAEGIAAAKAKGVKFGCMRKEIPEEFPTYYEMWQKGEISTRNAAKKLGMSHSTFYRRCVERSGEICCKG